MARRERGHAVRPAHGIERGALSMLLQELAAGPTDGGDDAWQRVLHPGLIVGKYELVHEIGRGGFGVVWEGRDRELNRSVAFKAIRVGGDVALREERLLREAEASAALSHPNLVTLFDAGRGEQGPYLVMELLRGQSLAERLAQGPLAVGEALRVAAEVAKGLAHAHAHGIVHRDLTPGNVFLCEDGQVKVLDLGMAHAFGHRREEGGTPGYMAPEQQRGAPEDERTDVFALGVLLFRMLTNELPFQGGEGRLNRRSPTLDVPGAPALGKFVVRMLEHDPVNRPRDGREVAEALRTFESELARTPSPTAAVTTRHRSPRVRLALLLAGVALAAGSSAAWLVFRNRGIRDTRGNAAPAGPSRPGPSVAVLPFADMSPGKDQEYLADGVAEEILNALTRVKDLRVIGRTSSFSFKGKPDDVQGIGRKLTVGHVVEGSLRRDGGRVRITARLVEVATGHRLWSQSYERELSDIFRIQDDVATSVADALRANLTDAMIAPAGARTADPEAYRLYLLGRRLMSTPNPDTERRAMEAFERALRIDPAYAAGWAGLSAALNQIEGRSSEESADLRRRAVEAAERAVALAPDLPYALYARGWLRIEGLDWAGAERDLGLAVRLGPGEPGPHNGRAILLHSLGRSEEATAEAQRAIDLDPLATQPLNSLGIILKSAGRLAEARRALERALEIFPAQAYAIANLTEVFLLSAEPREALELAQKIPWEGRRLAAVARAQHSLGRAAESRQALDELVARFANTDADVIAGVHAWRGEKDAAFHWLERALTQPSRPAGVKVDPVYRKLLRGDPRWNALLRKMNLPPD